MLLEQERKQLSQGHSLSDVPAERQRCVRLNNMKAHVDLREHTLIGLGLVRETIKASNFKSDKTPQILNQEELQGENFDEHLSYPKMLVSTVAFSLWVLLCAWLQPLSSKPCPSSQDRQKHK